MIRRIALYLALTSTISACSFDYGNKTFDGGSYHSGQRDVVGGVTAAVGINGGNGSVEKNSESKEKAIEQSQFSKKVDKDDRHAVGALIVTCHNFKPAMLGILRRKNERLVFSVPGGGVELDIESAIGAVKREVLEETGYTVKNVNRLNIPFSHTPNFSLYRAYLDLDIPVKKYRHDESVALVRIAPSDVPKQSWRFPDDKEIITELFEREAKNTDCGAKQ